LTKRSNETPQLGAYVSYTHVPCHVCGQLTRIEVCYPVVQASTLSKAKYCPLCGAKYDPESRVTDANGSQFHLVAFALFGREPTLDEVELVKGVYPMWDAYEHPTFKEFLRSLVRGS
jgi:hypothetical protein